MPKIVKASEMRLRKQVMLDPKTVQVLEELSSKENLSQGKLIDLAIELLRKQKELA